MGYFNTVGRLIPDESIMHFGIPERSGRYPYGSGERPYQHGGNGRRISRKQKRQIKQVYKARKDARQDFDVLRRTENGQLVGLSSGGSRKLFQYAKRHSSQQKSIVTNAISKHGGIKVSAAYTDEYNRTSREMVNAWRKAGYNEKALNRIEKALTDTKFKIMDKKSEENKHNSKEALNKAKRAGVYNEEFLTLTEPLGKMSESKLLSEYKSYLKDPQKYSPYKNEDKLINKRRKSFEEKASAMRDRGMSYTDISENLGISRGAVLRLLNE